ncbi:hypothetical protein CRUP_027992 [Coryphaenoides rupestris]|nr:hypothetical protein CRUP_027992 [Coryphaenoides rupestris]
MSLVTGGRQRREPSDAELQRVSKRLVEDAVSRALHQYKQETLQNGGGPNAAGGPAAGGPTAPSAAATRPPGNTKESTTAAVSAGDDRK